MIEVTFIFIFVAITAISGYYLKLLSKSGSVAAFIIGLAIGLGIGIAGLLILGFFFASSSFWSKYKSKDKVKVEDRLEKGSRRDWQQVTANGGAAALASLFFLFFPDPIWLIGFSISIASSNSDTWASEIGSLSKKPPLLIRTLTRTETGTSGAVSLPGTLAAIGGAGVIAFLAFYLLHLSFTEALIIFTFGFAGNVIDTILGAFFQVVYQCKDCGAEVEKLKHCSSNTIVKRGIRFINNDVVNFLSAFIAALLGISIVY